MREKANDNDVALEGFDNLVNDFKTVYVNRKPATPCLVLPYAPKFNDAETEWLIKFVTFLLSRIEFLEKEIRDRKALMDIKDQITEKQDTVITLMKKDYASLLERARVLAEIVDTDEPSIRNVAKIRFALLDKLEGRNATA